MSDIRIRKVTAMPSTLDANTIYIVKASADTEASMFITSSAGVSVPLKGVGGSVANTQVPFGSGTNIMTSNNTFTFDNTNKILSITGTDTTGQFNIRNSFVSGSPIQAFLRNSGGDVNIGNERTGFNLNLLNGNTTRLRINTDGNVLVNTTTALTGGGRIQVNGNVNCDNPTQDRHAVNLAYLNSNTINNLGQSLKNISNGQMQTTTNVYESVFDSGSNTTSKFLRLFDVTKRTLWDTVTLTILFRNLTTNSNKLGILRFSINDLTNTDFLEISSSSTNPYSGRIEIMVQYIGGNTYSIFGMLQAVQGTATASNTTFIREVDLSTNWRLRADFLSGISGNSNYGGQTNLYYTVDYKKSDNSILIT